MVGRSRLCGCFVWVACASGCTEQPRYFSKRSHEGSVIFREDFGRDALGVRWTATGPGARVEAGALVAEGLRNHPVWLDLALPSRVRIEFDAWATTEEGDIKVELFGDGRSYATEANYVATGYVVIFGGWNNSLSAIVRRDEHGRQRVTTRERKVAPDTRYHFILTRTDRELVWEVNGRELLAYEDPDPLQGPGQDRFAFSGWESRTHFDNLVIEAL